MIPCTSTRLSSRVRISRSFPMLPAGIPCPAPQNRNKVFSGSAKIVRRGYSPPGTGGMAAPLRKRREATEAAQTGWSDRRAYVFAELTTPAAPSSERDLFLNGAATPPFKGGESVARIPTTAVLWLIRKKGEDDEKELAGEDSGDCPRTCGV